MTRDARITLDWADDVYVFRLAWGQLTELQEKCNAGPYVVLGRISGGEWRVEDISHVIRLGLIGGGMEPVKALKLVRRYVEDRPPLESLLTAQAVLAAAVMGAPDEEPGKPQAGASAPIRFQTARSELPPFSEPEPQSA